MSHSVAIIIYSIIGVEFVYRIHNQKPIASRVVPVRYEHIELEAAQSGSNASLGKGRLTPNGSKHIQILLASLSFSTLCLFIRAIYRLVEVRNS